MRNLHNCSTKELLNLFRGKWQKGIVSTLLVLLTTSKISAQLAPVWRAGLFFVVMGIKKLWAYNTCPYGSALLLSNCSIWDSLRTATTNRIERHNSQLFGQARTRLKQKIFAQPPGFMNLGPEILLMMIFPLYWLVESGVHWLHIPSQQ